MTSPKQAPGTGGGLPGPTPAPTTTTTMQSSSSQVEDCKPVCTYQCTDKKCEKACTPECLAPECQVRCTNLSNRTLKDAGCNMDCKKMECRTVCPEKGCTSIDCPQCTASCTSPQCSVRCPTPACKEFCKQPKCTMRCKHPGPAECPKPVCKLTCESPASCKQKPGSNDFPPLTDGMTVVPSFPKGNQAMTGTYPNRKNNLIWFGNKAAKHPLHMDAVMLDKVSAHSMAVEVWRYVSHAGGRDLQATSTIELVPLA